MKMVCPVVGILAATLAIPVHAQSPPYAEATYAKHVVAAQEGHAADVGREVLRKGGNAVDAAVATAFALAVTLPNAGNIGGGGFMLVHDGKSGKDTAIDFREMAPAAATPGMYLDAKGDVVSDRSLFTHLAVGVPGTVAGLLHALDR